MTVSFTAAESKNTLSFGTYIGALKKLIITTHFFNDFSGTLVKVWRKVNFQKHVRIWQLWRRITKRSERTQ